MNNHIRKITTLIAVIISSIYFFGCAHKDKRILGEWKTSDNTGYISMVFDNTGHAVLVIGGQVVGGDNFEYKGQKVELLYKTDYDKKPYWIDFIMKDPNSAKKHVFMRGIFTFITDTKMEMRLNSGESERFYSFEASDKKNTLLLEKVQ